MFKGRFVGFEAKDGTYKAGHFGSVVIKNGVITEVIHGHHQSPNSDPREPASEGSETEAKS